MDAEARYTGYTRALSESGLKPNDAWFAEGDYSESGGVVAMAALLRQSNKFTAVLCANDDTAAGAMGEAKVRGLSIPEDLSFMGFDNSSFGRFLTPSLTSVSFPVSNMAETAAHQILSRVYKQKRKTIELKNVEVMERNSVIKL